VSIAPFLYEMIGRERGVSSKAGITMNVNVLAFRKHRLDSHQVIGSGRAAGDPLQFSVGPRTIAPACWPPSARGGS